MVVGFPEDILADIDTLVQEGNLCRSELIREACSFYLEEKRKSHLRERMKAGYQEMAEINRVLAEEIGCDFDGVPRCGEVSIPGSDTSEQTSGWRKT